MVKKRSQVTTLIEHSLETCNRFCYGIFPNLPAPMHTMKCIGLFKGLHLSTSVVNMYGNT